MKLPYSIKRQVPEFVRANHPAFVEFLRAYYQWYEEQYSIGRVQALVDIDDTVDEFVQYFKQQLDVANVLGSTDNRLFLKHIKELYAAKGSTSAFKFLFRILFNKESEVESPWERVIKPSDGKWKQDVSILIDFGVTSFDPATLVGDSIYVVDETLNKYAVFVNNVTKRSSTVYEVFIERFTPQSFVLTGIETRDGAVTGTTVYTTTSVKIQKGGKGFVAGQVFNISSYGGSGTVIKVKSVDVDGAITALDIIQFGLNYETNFNLYISPDDSITGTALGGTISLLGSGTSGGSTSAVNAVYTTDDVVNTQTDRGSIVRHDYTSISTDYLQDPTYVGTVVGLFKTRVDRTGSFNPNSAQVFFKLGYILRYPGYYTSSQSIVGDSAYIQDSNYYQVYSYVTVLDEAVENYSAVLKRVLHPAGTKHFGTYQLNTLLSPLVDILPSMNIIDKSDVFRDFVYTSELSLYNIGKAINDAATTADLFDRIVSYVRTYTDTATTSDTKVFNVDKALAISAAASEVFDRVVDYVRQYDEVATATDSKTFAVGIPRSDTALVADLYDRVVDYVREYSETAITSDDKTFVVNKAIDDTITTADVYSRIVDYVRTYTDTAITSDDKTFAISSTLPGDMATTTDQLSRVVDFVRTYTDTAITSDDKTFAISSTLPGDTATATESLSRVVDYVRTYDIDIVATSDAISAFGLGKALADTAITLETLSRTVDFARTYTDSATTTDLLVFGSTTTLVGETATVNDSILIEPGLGLGGDEDTVSAIDNVVLQSDKYINDSVSVSTSGSIYGGPIYVDVLTTVYWEVGYLENERLITN